MCAYNRLNGTYCSEHAWLLDSVLRDEWGFAGLVVSDWGAANERARGVAAGLDLEMPASGGINDARVAAAVRSGELAEAVLDRAATRNASLALLGGELEGRPRDVDHDAHHGLARRAAAQSAVLLKNDGGLLPLGRDVSIAVIGAFAQRPRYQGAGSSQVRPTRLDCAWDAMEKIAEAGRLTFAAGYDPRRSEPDQALIDEAVDLARAAEVAVVFAGLPGIYESEGFDRAHMRLPDQHNRLIAAVCDANPSTVVVLSNGAPVEMPWVDRPAVLPAVPPRPTCCSGWRIPAASWRRPSRCARPTCPPMRGFRALIARCSIVRVYTSVTATSTPSTGGCSSRSVTGSATPASSMARSPWTICATSRAAG